MLPQYKLFDEEEKAVLIERSGIEATDESGDDNSEITITEPFDPKEINITQEVRTIDSIVHRLREDEIKLDTDFQRKGNLWPPEVQSRLVESLMLRFPLPAFYFDAEKEDNWLVVDGLQRLWTFKKFIIDETLELKGLEILKDFVGNKFSDLPRAMQRRISETQITVHIIKPGTPLPVKYNIFRRINTGGFQLNFMEIRHALNQGPAATFLKEISEDDVFKRYVRVSDRRMADREIILRYVAFSLIPYSQYIYTLNKFLDQAMERLGKLSDKDRKILRDNFFKALEVGYKWFEERQFSRSLDKSDKTRVLLNQALFEVWTSLIARLNNKELENIEKKLILFIDEYKKVLKSEKFNNSLSRATTVPTSVNDRFSKIEKLLKKFSS